MVFLASHVLCSGMASLQFFLLKILNDLSVEASQAVRLRALSLEPLLARCKDPEFLLSMLNQEKQIDSADFKVLLVEIVGPGSNTSVVNLLIDLVGTHSPLSVPACKRLAVVFSAATEKAQLQIARLLLGILDNGPPVLRFAVCSNARAWPKSLPRLWTLLL